MNKKILAILMVFVVVVTCFAACKKHDYDTTKINGQDVLLATDKDGNTIINDDNQIVAVVTDREGEIITYENGEEQTYNIQISGSMVVEGHIQSKDFKLAIPKGWEGTPNNTVVKKGTENKCYIQFTQTYVLKDNEKFNEIFIETDKANEEIQKAFENEERMKELIKNNPDFAKYEKCKYTIDESQITFTDKAFPGKRYTHKIVDADGNVMHYVQSYYFIVNKTVYCLSYNCKDGVGYDESFDFDSFVRTNFTFKG